MGATLSSRAAPTAPRHFLADLNDGLHSAVRKNKFSQATSLLEEGADIYYRAPGPYGRSLLHQALVSQTVRRVRVVDSRRVPLVRLLCERGGLQLINALDNYGRPALRYAITSRCADLVRALLEGGASTELGEGSCAEPRRGRGVAATPRNIHVAAAASPPEPMPSTLRSRRHVALPRCNFARTGNRQVAARARCRRQSDQSPWSRRLFPVATC